MRIVLDGVTKSYDGFTALDAVSLEFPPGQVIALLGANGAGKTTLLRCLASIAAPSRGMILYDGEPFRRDRMDLRRRLSFLPDSPFVFPHLTPIRHIGMVLRLYEADKEGVEERVIEILREFDLLTLSEVPLHQLSRGQAYKSALAALLAVNPELWLLDEPFASGMDPQGISALKDRIREATAQGRTVLYSTQILEIAERFSDRVCVLHKGGVRAFDSLDRLREQREAQGPVLEEIFRELREEGP